MTIPIVTPPADSAANARMTPAQYAEVEAFAALPPEERASALFAKHQLLEKSVAPPITEPKFVVNKPAKLFDNITGTLELVAKEMRNGSLYVCIEMLDETVRDQNNKLVRRSIILDEDLSAAVFAEFKRSVNYGDLVEVTVRTKNLKHDLSQGVGLRGNRSFNGNKFVVNPDI